MSQPQTAEASNALSPEVAHQLDEAFSFVRHEREDVRKMALHGIAEQSKDSKDLWTFLSSKEYGPKYIDAMLQYLHAGGKAVLGDLLTILINCSADGSCAEMLIQRKVVRKAMRLLDGMERSDEPEQYTRGIEELTLMLLNNLTTSHISAVDELLQKEDEDMRGFYLGKLQTFYERLGADAAASGEAADTTTTATSASDAKGTATEKAAGAGRDLRRWVLHILLNVTRSTDGQELLLEDEDWRVTLVGCLSSDSPLHRLLAAQCYRNCGAAQHPLYSLLLKSKALSTAVERVCGREAQPEIQQCLAEFIASTLESEEGMAFLESINAKQLLTRAVAASKAVHSATVEVVEEDGVAVAAPIVLDAKVCEFVERHILPYLDDVVDAYLPTGCDEVD